MLLRLLRRDLSEISEPDADFRVAIESLTDMHKLPFCPDCFGELGWAEPVYGPGARQCMQCGSVFLVAESQSNDVVRRWPGCCAD
jgi:hypothetical protein